MPKLPGAEAIPRAQPVDAYKAQAYKGGLAEEGLVRAAGIAAESASKLVDGSFKLAGEEFQQRDQTEYSNARAQFLQAKVAQDNAYDDDPDHGTWAGRYGQQMQQTQATIGSTIQSGRVRQIFNDQANLDISQGSARLNDISRIRTNDEGRASAADSIEQNRKAALASDDPVTRQGLVDASIGIINAARDSGFFTASEAEHYGQTFVNNYETDRIKLFNSDLETKLDKSGNALIGDPSKFAATRTELLQGVDQSGLPESAKSKLRDKVNNDLALNALQGLIISDAPRALRELTGTTWDGYIDAGRKVALIHAAQQEIRSNDADARSKQADANAQAWSSFAIDLGRGKKSYADVETAYDNGQGWMTPQQHTFATQHLDKQVTQQEYESSLVNKVADAITGGQPLDPKDKQSKDGANLYYAGSLQQWGAAKLQPAEIVDRSIDYSAKIGIVPEQFRSIVRGNLRSTDPEKVVAGADTITRLRNANPQLLNDFSDEDLRLGNLVGSYTAAGVPPADAVKLALDGMKVNEATKKAREEAYDDARGKTGADRRNSDQAFIHAQMNSVFAIDPSVDAVMGQEFSDIAKAEYIRTGNLDAARRFALDNVNRVWGRTEVGGDQRYMKNPPELATTYGLPTMTPAQNSAWQNEQLLGDLKKTGFVDPSNPLTSARIRLEVDPTRKAPDGRPVYSVWIKGNDNAWFPQTGANGRALAWVPDWTSSETKKRQDEAAAKQLENLRELRRTGGVYAQPPVTMP